MKTTNIIYDEAPDKTIDLFQINAMIGQESPVIKAKLDTTNPSILNLSQNSSFKKEHNKMCSFNIENMEEFKKDFHPPNKVISLFSNKNTFNPGHCKSFSNEIFSNPNLINFQGKNKENEKFNDEFIDNDESSYNKDGEINFEGGYINFNENGNEDEDEQNNGIKNIYIENLINNDIKNIEDDDHEDNDEGYNILYMLKKRNSQD
jgi:hypothetical protein